ncbi:H/ACA ribonucleoprotein complex non-core subunit NAF1 [Juglans microcarpa x Juglans regia]|uniref:H/ACA ribonucleoprotein complex non-core subunit NAF1 n=1 Tax=Juglans microcarpa x Juglans regia TaxID=2249226 RepID=UPI001B7EB726|nr:H/ACA ribonucleoprotein complex non-core subunit NAF1 [Juglans microcarpa x Juglans regia]
MVGFISEPSSVDDLEQASKFKDSYNSLDPFDPTSAEFLFSDSFPDFDSIKDWFEDTIIPGMDDIRKFEFGTPEEPIELVQVQTPRGPEPIGNVSEPIVPGYEASVAGSGCRVKVEEWECENLGNSSYCIEEEMRKKVILGSDPGNSDLGCGNDMKSKIESDGDESGSSESESESSFSSAAASSTGSSDDEEEEEEEKKEKKVEVKRVADEAGEVEEGEIRDGDDEQEMKRGTDDDGENNEVYGKGMVDWSDVDEGDDDDECGATRGPIRSTHELEVLPPVPPVDVTLQPHHQMLPVGVVLSIIGAQVIIEGVEKHNPLSEGSILWITENRTPLGLVDEIFGPVKNPYYKVRYNSDNEVPSAIHAGSSISFVPEFANHVLNDKDLYKKGYDASGANDEEVTDEAEFSDDEKEAEYKRIQKMTKRGINEPNVRNKKNNRKVKNRDGQWKNAQPSSRQPQTRVNQLASTQNQHNFSPAAAFSVGQGYVSGPGLVPPFPQQHRQLVLTQHQMEFGQMGITGCRFSHHRVQSFLMDSQLMV